MNSSRLKVQIKNDRGKTLKRMMEEVQNLIIKLKSCVWDKCLAAAIQMSIDVGVTTTRVCLP